METIILTAPDISCEACQRGIESDLGKVAGIQSVTVDVPTKKVQVSYDPQKLTVDRIKAALDDSGYPVAS